MTTTGSSRAVVLARRPNPSFFEDCLAVVERPIPECPPGAVVIATELLSCDPYLLLRMRDTFVIGEPVPARAVARVVQSRDDRWSVGDRVWGSLVWAEHAVADPAALNRVGPILEKTSHALSVCGHPGLTAYIGMLGKARPRAGENVLVSGAAGTIGSIAGQLAANAGARVVGLVGSEQKARHLIENLGFHDAVARPEPDRLVDALSSAFPEGIDVVFENVGGPGLEAAMTLLRPGARVVLCGMVSEYGGTPHAVSGLMRLCGPEASILGLNVASHLDQLESVSDQMAGMVHRGEIRFFEDIVRGIENLPTAFIGMLRGDVLGKRLVEVHE